jgi:N6-L-threonylcarbamoyladenine synthase
MKADIHILAVESSCDDTSAAVFRNDSILANLVASQEVHKNYGGVVPELASRAHMQNIVPVVSEALKKAGIEKGQLSAIAFTRGPGLIGSLLVGVSFSKALAMALNIPIIEVNHMQAHVLAHFIEDPKPKFPFLCLTVSGGHTQIVLVRDYLDMEVIGHTTDDAAGEAFDKTAKILGLPYPGGPLVDKYAKEGDATKFKFAEQNIPGLDFSFSGFKTSVLYSIQKWQKSDADFVKNNLADLCASIQKNICDALLKKLTLAAQQQGITEIAIAGGVSANSGLRAALQEAGEKNGWNVYIPRFEYCTDNAGMIGITAYYKYLKGEFAEQSITPVARYEM